MNLCAYLLSMMVVGAYEVNPGMMHVELMNTETQTIEEIYVYTDEYLQCWEDGVPVQQPGPADWRGASATWNPWLPQHMDKQEQRRRIAQEIEDTIHAYHYYPHLSLVPDWFLRYWDLAEAICDYFDVPFEKPKLASEYKVE